MKFLNTEGPSDSSGRGSLIVCFVSRTKAQVTAEALSATPLSMQASGVTRAADAVVSKPIETADEVVQAMSDSHTFVSTLDSLVNKIGALVAVVDDAAKVRRQIVLIWTSTSYLAIIDSSLS